MQKKNNKERGRKKNKEKYGKKKYGWTSKKKKKNLHFWCLNTIL
jgi:hypothetical protein